MAAARMLLGSVACVAGLCVAGCAGSGLLATQPQGAGAASSASGEPVAPEAARERVAAGQGTRAEVATALGQAIVIPFDSGYEVWVYRWPGADRTTRAATELVVLFDPSGHVAKVRLRPGYRARPTDTAGSCGPNPCR